MATAAPPTPAGSAPAAARNLWQLPAFLLGVGAFVGVWQGWLPLAARDPAADYLRDLARLRAACDSQMPDTAEIKTLVDRVATPIDAFPEHVAAAHLALGTGYLRLAELTADPARAQEDWSLARQHFEAIRQQLPDPADAARLAFRSAKARAATLPANTPETTLVELRTALLTPPLDERTGEANRLAAELSLRLSPPDLKTAKSALMAYIGESNLVPPPNIPRAKLRLSEIHLLDHETDFARNWLRSIGTDAPADVLVTRSAQLARILMTDGDWPGAVREWEAVRASAVVPAALRPMAAYYLGVCKLSVKPADPAAARKLFHEAATATGPEGPAAAIRLARLHLESGEGGSAKAALGLLEGAARAAAGPDGYANPLVPPAEVRATFELAVAKLRDAGDFEAAVAATDAYKPAAGGKDRELRAGVLAAWGAALQKANGDFKPKLAAAAAEYEGLAPTEAGPEAKAEMFRRAAALYKQAGDNAARLAALDKLVRTPELPDSLAGPAWVEYVDGLVAANRPQDALKTFREIEKTDSPVRVEAQARLARALIDTNDPRFAPHGRELLQSLADKQTVPPAEAATHERVLVELAHEHIRKNDFKAAEAVLRKQLHTYPTGLEAGLGKVLRGVCLIQLASAKPEPKDGPKMREEALTLFEQVADEVERRQKAGSPRESDDWLRLHASLRILQTYLQLGQPDKVLTRAAPLLDRYRGTVEELIVLSLIFHAHKQSNRPEWALRTRDRMREVYDQLKQKPGLFPAVVGEYSREYWEKVWFGPDVPK